MKRHPYLIPFSRFHRSILFLALIAKKNAPKVKGYPEEIGEKIDYAIDFYQTRLLPHFETEAEKVFNFFRNHDSELDELIAEIENDRQLICEMFEKLTQNPTNQNLFHELGEKLEKHVRMEERQLFQLIQEKCMRILEDEV